MLSSHWPLSSPAASVPPSSASSVASFSPPSYRHLWNLFLSLPVLLVLRTVAKLTPYARQVRGLGWRSGCTLDSTDPRGRGFESLGAELIFLEFSTIFSGKGIVSDFKVMGSL